MLVRKKRQMLHVLQEQKVISLQIMQLVNFIDWMWILSGYVCNKKGSEWAYMLKVTQSWFLL